MFHNVIYPAMAVLSLSACSPPANETQSPVEDPRVENLRTKQTERKEEALGLRDPETGWMSSGGDAMLWEGKLAAVTCDVDLTKAETEPGKFQRDPDGETSDNPDWSDWSKDMGTGLLAYGWRCRDLILLERHAAYGEAHKALANDIPVWQMGQPVGDGRGLYLPAFIGRIYQTIYALGGENNINRLWPDFYQVGLADYQAHLQVMNIWHRGEVAEVLRKKGEDDASKKDVEDDAGQLGTSLVLDLTDDQLVALKHQAERDPRDPLFQAVYGTYTGDMGPALTACLAADEYAGEYVRCDGNPRACQLAALIFACDIVLRRFEGAPQ
jgi:hypothetical protein